MPLPKDPIKRELWRQRQSIAQTGKKQSKEHIEKRRISLITGLYRANTVICANCGEELKRIPCRAKGRNYCNAKCQMEYEYANGTRDRFSITEKAHEKIRQEGQPKLRGKPSWSAGKKCPQFAKFGKANPMYHKYGENHHNYKDGQTVLRKLLWNRVEYKEWRKAVYERDNYTCQLCGDNRGGNLNAHHKKSFKDFPELRYDADNGITLCQTCHREMHRKVAPILVPILIE